MSQKQTLEARRQRGLEAGVKFVKEFFGKLSGNGVEGVGAMYAKDAVMLDWKDTYEGEKAIKEFYAGVKGQRKYAFTSLVCQPSVGECVLVMAHGVQLTREDSLNFSRTFYLTKEGTTYVIQNDVTELKSAREAASQASAPQAETSSKSAPTPTPEPEPVIAAVAAKGGGGTSWADLIKSKTPAAPAASAPQRVIGGVGAKAEEEDKDKEKKADVKKPVKKDSVKDEKEKKGAGSSSAKRRTKSPTEKYQYAALYVSHVPAEMTENDIDKLFSRFGKIKGKTFKSGQYCFIDFEDKGSVRNACSEQITFKGQTLTVQERKSPEQRAAEKLKKEKDKKKK